MFSDCCKWREFVPLLQRKLVTQLNFSVFKVFQEFYRELLLKHSEQIISYLQ